jgi:hypothetical protein
MASLTIEQIKTEYPNEWVLLGLDHEEQSQIESGEVLMHGKDYLELCYKSSEVSEGYLTKIFFTGIQNHNRKWLKATRLSEKQAVIN